VACTVDGVTDPPAAPTLLELRLLQLFDALHQTRSVTRAAEQLGLSQPTVSIGLARLREALHDPLFVRTPAGMQPTPRADTLIVIAREALQSLRKLSEQQVEFVPASARRRFRICMTDASHVTLLPPLLAHVRAVAPLVVLEAARIDRQTGQLLESGEADLALGFAPWLEAGIYQQTLYPQDWVCLVNAAHPRIDKALGLDQYGAEAHVAITAGTGHQLLEEALLRAQVRRRVQRELPPGFEVQQHWHARYHEDAANRWLRGVVASLFMCASAPCAQS